MTDLRIVSLALAVLLTLGVAPAGAAALSYVSGKGSDAGDCSTPTNPCRSFQYALGKTAAGGEIKAMDAANYYALFINKSITITGVPGANITRSSLGDAITIKAGASDSIYLRNLEMNGLGKGYTGIQVTSAWSVSVVDSVIRGFHYGVFIYPSAGTSTLFMTDTLVTESGYTAIELRSLTTARISAFFTRVKVLENYATAINAHARCLVMVTDSLLVNNGGGVSAFETSTLRLARTTISRNGEGVRKSGASVLSYGDNKIDGNLNGDVSEPIDIIPTK